MTVEQKLRDKLLQMAQHQSVLAQLILNSLCYVPEERTIPVLRDITQSIESDLSNFNTYWTELVP